MLLLTKVLFLTATIITIITIMNASNAHALSPPSPNTSLTIVGASSTLGKLIIPDIPKLLPHYKSITLVTGPTNKSFPDLKKLLPSATLQTYTEFESSSAPCPNTDCLFITPPSSFASYSSTLSSLLPKFPPPPPLPPPLRNRPPLHNR
mmetsp:Transcript_27429/g.52013  ORF Transcript_27429/g.52013 Transcript_27429/m.52013 type:complete len:149 (-) Transcript_27429:50-496(-)